MTAGYEVDCFGFPVTPDWTWTTFFYRVIWICFSDTVANKLGLGLTCSVKIDCVILLTSG